MSRLVYSALTSLDGYVNDRSGGFSWAAPDPEVHAFVNEAGRQVGTHLYGRRMYETMSYWETALDQPDLSAVEREWAEIWLAADKIVYSRTLGEPVTARTRVERRFDPEAVRRLKHEAGSDLSIGGPELAAEAIRAGLVDDLQLYLAPTVVGGGQYFLPRDVRLDLTLVAERRFAGGTVWLHYRVSGPVG